MGTPSSRLGPPTVLVVDDEPVVLRFCQRVLGDARYVVLTAGSGSEALEIVERLQPHLDLLVTDLRMAGVGGAELAARLHQQRPALPVLFMTGTPADAEALPGPVLRKPFTVEQILASVRDVLARAPQGTGDSREQG